ncbi:MAG: glutaredoxin [Myxococcota bacterium]
MSLPNRVPHAPTAVYNVERFHPDVVQNVADAVQAHDVVVVGMGWNPFVAKARRFLDQAEIAHHDIDYGNYLSAWKQRLALKMWANWPTFPMVFVKGHLIGGATDTERALGDGSIKSLLDTGAVSGGEVEA